MSSGPEIAIGLPVFNGARYLASALDSLLSQRHGEFELILSDNGSEDATEEICRAYAARDRRIRYIRHDQNRGAAWNFNYVFEASNARYFKWAACDDLHDPGFLGQCKEALDGHPRAVLAFTGARWIDEQGQPCPHKERDVACSDARPHRRFRDLICVNHACLAVFGLIRSDVLARTGGIGAFSSSDRVLLAEMALHGPFLEIPEKLFFRRDHAGTSTRLYPDVYCRNAWFDPAAAGKVVFPAWRLLREHAAAISRSPLGRMDRMRCRRQLLPWLWKKKKRLLRDVGVFAASVLTPDRRIYTTGLKG